MSRRREYVGRLIGAGETRTMTGERGGYVVTAEAVRGAIEQGLFAGLACFADHATGGPSIRRLVGVWDGVRWDEAAGAAVGRLVAYETAETRPVLDLLDQWLDGPAPGPDLGVSLVFYPHLAADGRTVRGIAMVESADLVMFPASEGSRIVGRDGGQGRPPARVGGVVEASAGVGRRVLPVMGERSSHSQSGNHQTGGSATGSGVKRTSHSQSVITSIPSMSDEADDLQPAAPFRAMTPTKLKLLTTNHSFNEDNTFQPPAPFRAMTPIQATSAGSLSADPPAAESIANGRAGRGAAGAQSAEAPMSAQVERRLDGDGVSGLAKVPDGMNGNAGCISHSQSILTSKPSMPLESEVDPESSAFCKNDDLQPAAPFRAMSPIPAINAGDLPIQADGRDALSTSHSRTRTAMPDNGGNAGNPSIQPDGRAALSKSHSGTQARFIQRGRINQSTQPKQERPSMNQKSNDSELRRVALVRGDGATAERPAPAGEGAADWLDALRAAATTAVIRASGLPAAVQERLGEGCYESADEVQAAVEQARAELAALNEAGVVRLGGARPGVASLRLRDPLDEARGLMGFFFGAAEATTPPPNMRSFADLYVALTGDAHFRGVYEPDRVMFAAATSATLPNLAVDAMNRVVVEQFQALAHYRWYERIAAVAPNDGRLHDMKWITLGGIGALPAVAEGAAYTELSLSDAQETAAFVKRGGYVGITREMIKNSDIMQLQAIPRALATAAVRSRSAAVSALFTANAGVGPTLAQDSTALFHANHSNVATTALGSDATAWRAARKECFNHTELNSGKKLAVFPRFLLVPSDLYDAALSILGYGEGMPTTYTPEAQDRGFADPRPIPLVVPDWTDATDWAYIVDPAVYPVIQMSYSQSPGGRNHPAPELFAVTSQTNGLLFTNDTLPIKVRDEFAVGVNGPRGIGKRNVAG